MRAIWTIVRLVLVVVALITLFVTPLFVSSPSGTSIDSYGAVIDAVALVVLFAVAWSLWRDRRALL